MSLSAEVVVIGGGVNGTSTAFHLAQRGVRVTLLERASLAAGATGKSGALVRMHYTNPHDSALAQQSLAYFQHWGDLVGAGDPGYRQVGVARLVEPRFDERLRANVAMLQGLGVNTEVISPDDLRAIDPGVQTGDITCAAWEPESGYADPAATAYGFAEAARRLGADVHEGVEATSIEIDGDKVTGVVTPLGRIATETVVVAPGARASALLAPLGLDFGLMPNRVQIVIMRRTADDEPSHPVYIDGPNNTWLRPEGDFGTLCGIGRDQLGINPDRYSESVDADYIADARDRCAARRPALANSFMRGGWAGIITMSPDGHAIIDQLEPHQGLFGILGDSGTNFKTAPAIGKCVAEWITAGEPQTVDLREFRAARFAEGQPFHGEHEYGDSLLDVFR
ncbi:MAG: dependent oxidoreductase [Thermomicrobiales bacterium]|jgi:sarcosine oxidase subunit beta|nr:dependent oxidoreductase [Thermomicrobiales bacterium]